MNENEELQAGFPDWLTEDYKVMEPVFCRLFLREHPMRCIRGRFLCFGNGALTALHDRSDGFFRRQIVLTTRDKPAERMDGPFLSDKLIAEREGIFLWCLEGFRRL